MITVDFTYSNKYGYKKMIKKFEQFSNINTRVMKWKRKVRKFLIWLTPPKILEDKDYFSKIFNASRSVSQNLRSLSFEKGIVVGNFRETSYLLHIRPQNLIESQVYLNEIWEPHIAKLVAGYLNEPNIAVVDVGANVGATSIPLAKHFPHVSFHLFEPHPIVFEDLKNNLSINKLSNVEAQNIAITDSGSSFMPFYAQINAKNFGLSSFTLNHDIEDYEVIQVKCEALDDILSSQICVRILKIDTQGHELQVLRSAQKLISKHRPIILFEFESEYFSPKSVEVEKRNEILKFFEKYQYDLYMIGSDIKYLPKLTLQDYFRGDIIAVPLPIKN